MFPFESNIREALYRYCSVSNHRHRFLLFRFESPAFLTVPVRTRRVFSFLLRFESPAVSYSFVSNRRSHLLLLCFEPNLKEILYRFCFIRIAAVCCCSVSNRTLNLGEDLSTVTAPFRIATVLLWFRFEACYDRGSTFWLKRFLHDGALSPKIVGISTLCCNILRCVRKPWDCSSGIVALRFS